MIYHGKSRVPVREAVLHCAAINTGQFDHMSPFQVFATINRWHIEQRGFRAFGYHGLFMPDGAYYPGRPFGQVGAHVIGHNVGTLGFLMIESRKITHIADDPRAWFRPYQLDQVGRFLRKIPGLEKVSGHNDHAPKLCPGFHVKSEDWL